MLVRALHALLAVHRHGTVAAAAEHVHLSQAAVSAQLKNIEQELGVELFVRGPRSLAFTPAGDRLVGLAEQMLAVYEQMKALGDSAAAPGLAIGAIESVAGTLLPRVLRHLAVELPGLSIKVGGGRSLELLNQLEAGSIDVAVVVQPASALSAQLSMHVLHAEPLALLVPPGVAGDDVDAVLAAEPRIAVERTTPTGQLAEDHCRRRGLRRAPAIEFDTLEAVAAAVRQRLGVAIVPLVAGASWTVDPTLRALRLPGVVRHVVLVEQRQHRRSGLTRLLRAAFDAAVGDGTPHGGAV